MTNYMRVKHNMGGSFTTFKQEKEISLSYQRVKTLPSLQLQYVLLRLLHVILWCWVNQKQITCLWGIWQIPKCGVIWSPLWPIGLSLLVLILSAQRTTCQFSPSPSLTLWSVSWYQCGRPQTDEAAWILAKRAIMQQQVNHVTEYVQRPTVHSMLVTETEILSANRMLRLALRTALIM